MENDELIELEDQVEEQEQDLTGRSIHTTSADAQVDSLYGRYRKGRLNIQPSYQRHYVWDAKKASLLIESILLGIPIPIIYLAEDQDNHVNVIDGQQRLTSLFSFIDGKLPNGKVFKLTGLNVFTDLKGKTFQDLSDAQQSTIEEYPLRTITFTKDSDPDCDDVIRVAFMHMIKRARLSELVQLLTGRDFETREFKEEITEETFRQMYEGVLNVINEYNFKQFMQTIRGAGFISSKMVTSNMALDFAYALHLMLRDSDVPIASRKRIVQKWYVLSILTGRYSASPESAFAKDLKVISEVGIAQALKNIEDATLSDNFWEVALPQNLSYASSLNPTYLAFLASQIYFADMSLLSQNIRVSELITLGGDVHHIFPKKYLVEHGFERTQYNQTANYAYLDTPVNISIGKKAPKDYFSAALAQCGSENAETGSIIDEQSLRENLEVNCIPEDIFEMDYTRYDEFLEKRRALMAKKIRKYYESL